MSIAALALAGCGERGPLPLDPFGDAQTEAEGDDADDRDAARAAALAELNSWEAATRKATDFSALPPFEKNSGTNPHALAALGNDRAVGLLRGSSEVVLLDDVGKELDRTAAPDTPVDLAVVGQAIFVVGEGSGEIHRYEVRDDALVNRGSQATKSRSLRAIAARSPTDIIVADSMSGEILRISKTSNVRLDACHEPIDVALTANARLVNCLGDHQIRIHRKGRGQTEVAPITHRGPVWAMAVEEQPDGALFVALAGIEDRPLDRSDQGSFGYVDSYVFLYELAAKASTAKRVAEINVGEQGLITPKWIAIEGSGPSRRIVTAGFGSQALLTIHPQSGSGKPRFTKAEILPGTTSRAIVDGNAIFANSLFDGWERPGEKLVPLRPIDKRTTESRIGELLFFTELMAPWSSSTGRLSRFTCEACHFEGYVDGRTHFTGRDDVSATSRPLRGLFNNAPHFTRALDETSTEMVDNEFRVANKLNGRDPWFELKAEQFPWLAKGGLVAPETMSPKYLRRALMTFLRDFTHQANPNAKSKSRFTKREAAGAALFRDQCESCHRAQLDPADETTRVPFASWEKLVFSESGALVWGRMSYEKTGIQPYVHERGARPPTLRRLYKKWPYFTNGSAKSLQEVVERSRYDLPDERFSHAGESGGKNFEQAEQRAMLEFLVLL